MRCRSNTHPLCFSIHIGSGRETLKMNGDCRVDDITAMDITATAEALVSESFASLDLTERMLERIARVDPHLKAYIEVLADEARISAAAADAEIRNGKYRGPLHGIPIAIKAVYDVGGVKTTSCSKVRENYVPSVDSTIVRKLKDAGAVILGMVSCHEFAFGFDSVPTRNPWNLDHIPSGSSGGTGAAVAAGLCFAGTGTDTGGSIRAPSAANGIAGIKPSYGRVSKAGITSLSWSLDHAGPMAKSVRDLALLLNIMAGTDPRDPQTIDANVPDYTGALFGDIRGMRLGVPTNYFFHDVQSAVGDAVMEAIRQLQQLGAVIVPVTLPINERLIDAWVVIAMAEAAVYHQHSLRATPDLYGEDVRILLEAGELTLATTYLNAQRVRLSWKSSLKYVMRDVDVIVTPTLPNTAMKAGETSIKIGSKEETVFAVSARFCAPFDMAGLPAASVPCGFAPNGLPIGLQIVGKPFDEEAVLKVSDAFERNTEHHLRRPQLPGLGS
jgi:aspartyl-tRNA(Asn)/glutamyl-tRNA(Gln) amidotransferase subunit A